MTKTPKKEETIVIMDELRNLLDLPSDDERKELERILIEEGGPRDPIVIWDEQNAIVDGHNRYGICKAHDLPYKTVRKSFKDIDAVKEWMLRNQLGRRNLSPVRFSYYIGTLYNMQKQTTMVREKMEKTTAEQIAETFQDSERTVRRAGEEAKGIDAVGRALGLTSVTDKIAAIKAKNEGQVPLTKDELATIGKVEDPKLQEEVVKETLKIKAEEKAVKDAAKEATKPAAKTSSKKGTSAVVKSTTWPVAFCKPSFDAVGYNPATEPKPPLSENAMLYMSVPDEEMGKAMELIKRWGLNYEGSFIFQIDGYEGLWSDIRHVFMICASRGTVTGPKKSLKSIQMDKGDTDALMMKLINSYHPQVKGVDMRKKGNSADGWDKPQAAYRGGALSPFINIKQRKEVKHAYYHCSCHGSALCGSCHGTTGRFQFQFRRRVTVRREYPLWQRSQAGRRRDCSRPDCLRSLMSGIGVGRGWRLWLGPCLRHDQDGPRL